MKYALVTGASTGIGYHTAKAFVDQGYHVFVSVRKQADAEKLSREIGPELSPLLFDVTDTAAIAAAERMVREKVGDEGLAVLVNNAGIATSGPLMHQDIDDIRKQFEVNVIGQIAVIQAFLPLLGAVAQPKHAPGRIINISSVGGKVAAPFLGAYAGSKHALEGMSHSLRRELQLYGIDVIIIGPGAIKTPIWEKPSATDLGPYVKTAYKSAGEKFQAFMLKTGRAGLEPSFLGKKIVEIAEKRKPKVRYTFAPNKFRDFILPLLLPARMIDRALKKNLGLDPKGGGKGQSKGRYI